MTSPAPSRDDSSAAPPGRGRRMLLWAVVVGALVIGAGLALVYGPRVTPFLDVAR